jgi:uncharacterized protein (TIGR02679 family)
MERKREDFTMTGSKACAEYLLHQNVKRYMNEIKKRWCSYEKMTGRIKLQNVSEEEKTDLTKITGIRFYGDSITLSVKDFEDALQHSKFSPIDLQEVLDYYFEYHVLTNKQKIAIKENENQAFENKLFNILEQLNATTKIRNWLQSSLEHKDSGYRILKKIQKNRDYSEFENVINGIKIVLEKEQCVPIAIFASQISGNPHFLDKGQDASNLFVSILCYLNETKFPENMQEWYDIFGKVGLIKDEIAGSVAIYNVHLERKKGLHLGSEECYKYGQPFMCAYANLKDIISSYTDNEIVYVVENEMVFSYLLNEIKDYNCALICTSGQLSTTAQVLLSLLSKKNIKIYYSGDLDPEGISICDRLCKKYCTVQPWHMDVSDYKISLSNEEISDSRLIMLDGIQNEKLKATANVIQKIKKAGYQENILSLYIEDLKNFKI